MLTPKQLAALDKLEALAAAKLQELYKERGSYNSYHDPEMRMLDAVPNWVRFVKSNHHASDSAVESCLKQLRQVAWQFMFDLKQT
jgi:hypothetical protein